MSLIQETKSLGFASTDKTIIRGNVAQYGVIYTVPFGRKWVGTLNCGSTNPPNVNGVPLRCFGGSGTSVASPGGFNTYTFLGGTVIKEGYSVNTTSIFGIESDA
jgi:hypothetical protein